MAENKEPDKVFFQILFALFQQQQKKNANQILKLLTKWLIHIDNHINQNEHTTYKS